MSNKPLVQFVNVSREYVNGEVVTPALRGVTVSIDQGEFVAVMGPSGSGKSTLMHIMGFLDTLTGGTYLFDGVDVSGFSEDHLARMRKEKVGFVFQAFNLLAKSTVLQNVLMPTMYCQISRKERMRKAQEAIAGVSMEHRAGHFSNQLSGGEKQRVAIARALVNNPAVIFADEPTGNLDTKTGTQILELLAQLHDDGRTIVMVTHETEAAHYASRVLRLRDGLLESDTTNGIRQRGGYNK
jgi:putative ABC transport system ATP-binding protein